MGCGGSNVLHSENHSFVSLLAQSRTNEVIHFLSQQKALEINEPINFKGDTILHYACAKNNAALVEFLLKQNFDPLLEAKKMNWLGESPADLASDEGIIKQLNK